MSVDEIAGHYGVSRNHLANVAQRLQGLGYVATQRGRGGGMRLAQEAGAINVGTVVRQFENLDTLVECMDAATSTCPVRGACGLQGVLGHIFRSHYPKISTAWRKFSKICVALKLAVSLMCVRKRRFRK